MTAFELENCSIYDFFDMRIKNPPKMQPLSKQNETEHSLIKTGYPIGVNFKIKTVWNLTKRS